MSEPSRADNDFVLGMSLTEVVLLLVFCLLFAFALTPNNSTRDVLAEENERLRDSLTRTTQTVRQLRDSLQWASDIIGYLSSRVGKPINGKSDIDVAIQILKRGFPKCEPEANTLADVSAVGESLTIAVRNDPAHLKAFSASHGLPLLRGMVLRRADEIDRFLSTISAYQDSRVPPCRFDYRLAYRTSDDYHKVRQGRIEKVLYPETPIRVPF